MPTPQALFHGVFFRCAACRLGFRLLWRWACFFALLLWASIPLCAQQSATFVQYWRGESQWNAAAVGESDHLNVLGKFQRHASGFANSGSTLWAGADIALRLLGMRHGVGASFGTDEMGLFSHQHFSLQYALHRRLLGGQLSWGAQIDLLQERLYGSKADLGESNDPAFPTSDQQGSGADVGFGLRYDRGGLRVGISGNHLLAPTVSMGDAYRFETKRRYNAMVSYNIPTKSPFLRIVPSAMWRSDLIDHRFDLSARAEYEFERRRFYGGANYAPSRSVSLFVGGVVRGIELTYSYEAFTSALGIGSGQHEVTLGYRFALDLRKGGRQRHKSVRWL